MKRTLNCSENVDEKAVQQKFNEDLKLECYDVLSDEYIE